VTDLRLADFFAIRSHTPGDESKWDDSHISHAFSFSKKTIGCSPVVTVQFPRT
jgi:hypothetical protein